MGNWFIVQYLREEMLNGMTREGRFCRATVDPVQGAR
jgi:hypothetical protein